MFAKLKMFLGFGGGGEAPKEKISYEQTAYQKLKSFRDIGQTFNYLGRTLIVTGFNQSFVDESYPALVCDYVDDNGRIRRISFLASELPGLIAQQS